MAKVSSILYHRGIKRILAYSWARPILVAGKGREGMFLILLFRHFHSCSFFFPVLLFHLLFVCVEVLRPSQPNGVMSSVVSLPNHTFTGQA